MSPFSGARDPGIRWLRSSRFERNFVLQGDDGRPWASVAFDGLIGRQALARCGDRRWTISTSGWLRPVVQMQDLDSGARAATMRMQFLGWAGKGTVALNDGQQFAWGPASLVVDRRWGFTEVESGDGVLSFEKPVLRQTGNTDLLCARLAVLPAAQSEAPAALLSVLGMYLLG